MKKQETKAAFPPKDVLIVEDSATQAVVLKHALEKHGWRVRVAGDGVEALEMARRSKPDIVVSDIRMPKMDGYALSKAIKTDPFLCAVPVVLFTSLSQPRDVIDAINSRADYYFLKQWDHDVLIAKIASVLDTYRLLTDHSQDGLTVRLEGETYTIEANAQQPLSLLLSTYEIAVQQSMQLAAARDKLREANESLEATVRARTAQFMASETRYRRLFEAAKDGILILDAETGMVVDVNPFLAGLLGYSHEEFLGKTIWELGFMKDIVANRDNFLALQQKGYVRYERLPMERRDGRPLDVEVVSNVYMAGDKKVIQCNIRDITERTVREKQQKLAMQVLATLNRGNDVALLVKDILILIKESMGFEAVGIRLRDGDDFPYYETNGFPTTFVEAGRCLGVRDAAGELIRNAAGEPVLECMCGNVLCGRFDPAQPFFTPQGSFWTNNTTNMMASTTEQDRLSRMRNCCHGEGYESVALIPLRSGGEVIGLLQFNDHRKGMFTLGMIQFFEGMGASIGIAVKRRRNVEALRDGEARYRTLFEDARDGIAVADAETGKLVDCNHALCRMVGREKADLVGQPQSVLHPPSDLINGQSPTFRDQRRDPCGPAGEDRLLMQNGKVIPVEITGTNVQMNGRNYLMGVFRDITVQKQAEIEQRRLSAAIEQSAEIVVITDVQATIQYVNPAFTRITGYTSEEATGQNPRLLKSGAQDAAFYRDLWSTILDGKPWTGRFVNRKKDGACYTEEAVISPVRNAAGDIVNFVAVKRDITNQLSMEAQLRQSQKLESIGTLAGGVAHEINNPIMGIMNYAQLIADQLAGDSPLQEYAREIMQETERVATIVRNMLSFARQDKQSYSPARMCDIVESTLSLIRAVMRHDQVTLVVDVPADLPQLKCRSQQIQQVIMNLLTNARDALNAKYPGYDETKKVLINARMIEKPVNSEQLSVISDQSSADTDHCARVTDHSAPLCWLRLTVEDHGVGIPDDVRERIFEPFFTTKPRDKGTGLGLSISHSIVRDHGGQLSVESEVGQWTRFHLDLPVDTGY